MVRSLAQKPLFLGQTWPSRRPSPSVRLARSKSPQCPAAGSEVGRWPLCHSRRARGKHFLLSPTQAGKPGSQLTACLGLAGVSAPPKGWPARSDPKLSVQANGLPSERGPWRPGSLATFTSEVEVGPAGPSLQVFGSQSWGEAVDRTLIQLQVRQHSSGTCSGPAGPGLLSRENEASSCLQGAASLHGAQTPLFQGVSCSRRRTQEWGSAPLVSQEQWLGLGPKGSESCREGWRVFSQSNDTFRSALHFCCDYKTDRGACTRSRPRVGGCSSGSTPLIPTAVP